MGKILKDLTTYTPEDKVLFFLRNFPKECEDNFDIIQDYMRKFNMTERLEKIEEVDVSQDFYNYRSKLLKKLKNNFNLIDSKFSLLPAGNSLQKYVDMRGNCEHLFYRYEGDDLSYIKGLDTSKSTSMAYMFQDLSKDVNFEGVVLDCSNCTNYRSIFESCRNLTSTPHLTNIRRDVSGDWYNAFRLGKYQSVNVDYIYANDLGYLFDDCDYLIETPDICVDESCDNLDYVFEGCNRLTKIKSFIVKSNIIKRLSSTFCNCPYLTELPLFETKNISSIYDAFRGSNNIIELPEYDFSSVTNVSSYCFYGMYGLKRFRAKNLGVSFSLSSSTNMTREALLEVINNVKDLTGSTGATLTLGSTLLAKLTEDDIAIATNKNWTLA